MAGAGVARIENGDFTFPLGMQQIVIRADLFRFHQFRALCQRIVAGEGFEGIDKPFAALVVAPDVAAPPLFGIFDFRQNHIGFERFGDGRLDETVEHGVGAADAEIEVANPGFVLFGDFR